MNCKAEWEYKILISLFTRNFVDGTYKKHTEKILFDRERALLPATQPLVEEEKRKKLINDRIIQIRNEMKRLKTELQNCYREYNNSSNETKQVFVKKCPVADCRGFLSSQWKCGMCETWSCSNCHEIKGLTKTALHICKKENVETARLIEKDTKPCPKCACPIFKIEGCDQMFCTQCQTPFSWRSGRVENGVIHNPHYFEWQRQRGTQERNLLEVRCGREIDNVFLNALFGNCSLQLENITRYMIHIRIIELPKYVNNRIRDNQDLRIKYLKSEISEEKFKQNIQKRQKTIKKHQEIANILHVYVNSLTEILYRYADDYKKSKFYKDGNLLVPVERKYIKEWSALTEYVNECFLNVSKTYKSQRYSIDTSGDLVSVSNKK
jgi:hypothetical protein